MIIGNVPAGPTDLVRQLVNLAINAGRSLQSSQTGYIHYCYRVLDYPTFDTIPLVENFLFALALLRERTAESFAEGKALVDKLRHFQHASGNFPVYLHEFPECKDYYTAVHLLPIFYWILRTFPLVLGSPLRDEFQQTVERSFDYCLKLKEEKLPFIISLKLACGIQALANLWQRKDIETQAEEWLDELRIESENSDFSGWFIPELLGEALVCLEMVYGDLVNSPWTNVWKHLRTVWHQRTASYVGPGYRDYQFREQPEVTLLDLVAGFHTGIYSYRAMLNGPHMLQAALIHPTDEKLNPLTLPRIDEGSVAGRRWYQETQDLWAFSTLEKHTPDPSRDNAYSAFRLLWGSLNCAHTFVCQGGNVERAECRIVEGGADLILYLPAEVPGEARQRNREVMFALDAHEDVSFIIADLAAASTFQLGEEVLIKSGAMTIGLKITLDSGSGQFFGHITKGNRTSQKHTTGDGRFKSYDWQLFLRTVERHEQCSLRAEVRFKHEEPK